MLAPLGIVFFMSMKIQNMKHTTAQWLFWVFSILMGASLSYVFMAYTATSIVRVFFITMGMFGAMSIYGYVTKRSLVSWGSFLFMGLIGVIIAMVVNIFLQSEMMHFVISVIGVLVFLGLTAYDTQRIKDVYRESDGKAVMVKKSVMARSRSTSTSSTYSSVAPSLWRRTRIAARLDRDGGHRAANARCLFRPAMFDRLWRHGAPGPVAAFQRSLTYFPDRTRPTPANSGVPELSPVTLETEDGLALLAWYAPPRASGRPEPRLFAWQCRPYRHAGLQGAGLSQRRARRPAHHLARL